MNLIDWHGRFGVINGIVVAEVTAPAPWEPVRGGYKVHPHHGVGWFGVGRSHTSEAWAKRHLHHLLAFDLPIDDIHKVCTAWDDCATSVTVGDKKMAWGITPRRLTIMKGAAVGQSKPCWQVGVYEWIDCWRSRNPC
jgi:hypothetical protein